MLYDTLRAGALRNDGLDGVRVAALDRARWFLDLVDWTPADGTSTDGTAADGTSADGAAADGVPVRSRRYDGDTRRSVLARRLPTCADADGRAFLVALLLAGAGGEDWIFWHHASEIRAASSRARGWSRDETAVLLLGAAEIMPDYRLAEALDVALTAAERLDPEDLYELAPWFTHVSGAFARADIPAGYRGPLAKRLWALMEIVDEAFLPDGLMPVSEVWAAPLRASASTAPALERARFVRHLVSLSSPRPTAKWRRTCLSLMDAVSLRDTVAACLRSLAEDDPPREGEYGYLVHHDHGDLARGVVWAASLAGGPETVQRLETLALRAGANAGSRGLAEDLKLAGAAINALGAADDPGALESLWRLRSKIKHRALRKQLDTALQTAAGRQGITPAQLVERSVPSHGLRPDGSLERTLGAHTVRVAVQDAATVRLAFTGADGKASKTAPAAVKDGFADELKQLKALAKEVRATLATERARVESLMSDDREWPFGDWREHYRDHPITGVVVRGLIWEFQGGDGAWHASMTPPDETPARVRLWHPIRDTMDGIRAWRERIVEQRVRQPFKQAFREIYLLTPAEEETGTYSNRFAAHIVRYRRLYALFKERGWQANFLGRYEGGHNGEARGEFGGGEWRACFYHDPADEADWAPEYASTDQVRFERRQGRGWADVPLADVPPVVFSEAMRDVDLFVGVTSIATDAEWTDRGEDRFAAYWRETTFGELTANAEVRRAALERVLPRTKIADRCRIEGRYLVVKGELRTYKIHLGSSNILMEPDDSYLCVVQARGKTKGTPYLPFEDERLSLIISKAFLLAADHEITDRTILHQIKPVTT